MKTPVQCRCAVCNADLTSKPTLVERRLGRGPVKKMMQLRAPPRARITYETGGGTSKGVIATVISLWLCERHAQPGDAWSLVARLLSAQYEAKTKRDAEDDVNNIYNKRATQ